MFHNLLSVVYLFLHLNVFECTGRRINIAFFLNNKDNITEIVIKNAVRRINLLNQAGPTVHPIIYQSHNDIYKTGQQLCDLIDIQIAAVFGPELPEHGDFVRAVTSALQIPQFQVSWNPRLGPLMAQPQTAKPVREGVYNFNIHPHPYYIAKSLGTLVQDNDWKSYTILYEDEVSLFRLQEILKVKPEGDPAVVFMNLGPGPDYRTALKEVKASGTLQFILDCDTDNIIGILKQAKEVKLLEEYHSYIITSLDAHTVDIEKIEPAANITTIRFLDPNSPYIKRAISDWQMDYSGIINPNHLRMEPVLLYDAINLFITTYTEMENKGLNGRKKATCMSPIRNLQNELAPYLRNLTDVNNGILLGPLSGSLEIDPSGLRSNFMLKIFVLDDKTYKYTATWRTSQPNEIVSTLSEKEKLEQTANDLKGRHLRVVSRSGLPYLMEDFSKPLNDKARYQGYGVDLIDNICKKINCQYSFEVVPDGSYGKYDEKTKKWDGIIGYILSGKADLGVCDLTITYERRKAVDFTIPFMSLGVSILYAKAIKEPPELLSFSHPLFLDVWLYIATAYLIISFCLYLVARLNPDEWENPHPCNATPDELENIWDIKNCCWLTLGSIMAQGCDILPKGISTRMVTGMWWFFSLIITASYTANLAAFLTVERMGPTINSAEDLVNQNKIKFGCLQGGATWSFFKTSNFSTYHRMWVQMESADPSVFEKNNPDGVKRVLTSKRKYAFLMESTQIEYEMERKCDLRQVGHLLDSKGFGIAMRTNAEYRKAFNAAILSLQEQGTLHSLKEKWWKQMNGGGQCKKEDAASETSANELGMLHVGGVFVVLTLGMVAALIIAIFEFLWNVRKVAVKEQITPVEALKKELKFALNVWVDKKKVYSSRRATIEMDRKDSNGTESKMYIEKYKQ